MHAHDHSTLTGKAALCVLQLMHLIQGVVVAGSRQDVGYHEYGSIVSRHMAGTPWSVC